MQPRDEHTRHSPSKLQTVRDCYARALDRLEATEARFMVCDALSMSHAELLVDPDRRVPEPESARLENWISRRTLGEPLAYITGWRSFRTIEILVTDQVLIPRFETEGLVGEALRAINATSQVLDLGTGSGCIALSIQKESGAFVTASDVSLPALEVCRENAQALQIELQLVHSDWYSHIPGRFDVIVSNPPYVTTTDGHMGRGDLRFEPRGALDGGPEGLDALRQVIRGAPRHLRPRGFLFVEHGADQAQAVQRHFDDAGFGDTSTRRDLEGRPRVTGGILA